MPVIRVATTIRAPIARVFDLARSIDAHIASTDGTGERAVAGVVSGLIGPSQTVTWQARHFGVRQRLSVRIAAYQRAEYFEDEMVAGVFSHMRHRHEFHQSGMETEMLDLFDFRAPLGPLGRLVEALFLERYMEGFLKKRANALKHIAETDEWRRFLVED